MMRKSSQTKKNYLFLESTGGFDETEQIILRDKQEKKEQFDQLGSTKASSQHKSRETWTETIDQTFQYSYFADERSASTKGNRRVRQYEQGTLEPVLNCRAKPNEEGRDQDPLQDLSKMEKNPVRNYHGLPWMSKSPSLQEQKTPHHFRSTKNVSTDSQKSVSYQNTANGEVNSIRPRRRMSSTCHMLNEPIGCHSFNEFHLAHNNGEVLAYSKHFAAEKRKDSMKIPYSPFPHSNDAILQLSKPERISQKNCSPQSRLPSVDEENDQPLRPNPKRSQVFTFEEKQISNEVFNELSGAWKPLRRSEVNQPQNIRPENQLGDAQPRKRSSIFDSFLTRFVPNKPTILPRYGRAAMTGVNDEQILRYRNSVRRNEVCDSLDDFMKERTQIRALHKRLGDDGKRKK